MSPPPCRTLTHRVHQSAAGKGAIGQRSPLGVHLDVYVGSPARVVSGENGRELGHTILVGGERAPQPRLVLPLAFVTRIRREKPLSLARLRRDLILEALSRAWVTSVVARRIGHPEVNEHIWHGLARLYVNDADVHEEEETELVLCHVGPNRVPLGVVVGPLGCLWRQYARRVADTRLSDGIAGHHLLLLAVFCLLVTIDKVLLHGQGRATQHLLRPIALAFCRQGGDCWRAVVR